MSDDSEFDPHDRREWLLAIGRRLRADYDALKEPVPERLAALVKQY
jgi:Anti-sigma factor NepR